MVLAKMNMTSNKVLISAYQIKTYINCTQTRFTTRELGKLCFTFFFQNSCMMTTNLQTIFGLNLLFRET